MKHAGVHVRTEVFHNGEWVPAHLDQLEKGDKIRQFNVDGTFVKDFLGRHEKILSSDIVLVLTHVDVD